MIGVLRGLALFLGALVLQWWWNSHLSYWGAAPQLLLALTVLVAARRGAVPAMLSGFGWGLSMDASRAELFGASALTLTLLAYLAGLARRHIDLRAAGPLAVSVFLASWGAFVLHGLLGLAFTRSFEWSGWKVIVFTPFLNSVAVLVASTLWDARGERR